MSAYSTTPACPSVTVGNTFTLFSAESPTPGTGAAARSARVALAPLPGGSRAGFSVDIQFAADPGAFEVDIQGAQTDATGNYVTLDGGNITALDANFHAHVDFPFPAVNFVSLLLPTRTNPVALTATISR